MSNWIEIVGRIHATLERVKPQADGALLARRGLEFDPAGNYFFNRPAERILQTRLATGCDDFVKVFLHWAREAGVEAWMVWAANRSELEIQEPGRPLVVEGTPLVIDPARSRRLMSGHQMAAVLDAGAWSLVDPSHEGEGAIAFDSLPGRPAAPPDLPGVVVPWAVLEKAWPRYAAKLVERRRAGSELVVRRASRDSGDGNSAERLQKIYASGNPDAPSFVVEAAGYAALAARSSG